MFEAKFLLFPVLEVSVAKRSASFLLDLPPLSTLLLPLVRIRTRDFTLGDKGLSGIVGARHRGPKLAVEKESGCSIISTWKHGDLTS
jgi:hypothetical protein